MKVTCSKDSLSKAIDVVSRAVAPRATLPILGHIMLQAEGGQLELAATDLGLGIRHRIVAEVQQPGATTVPGRLLADLVKSLPDERITMTRQTDQEVLRVECGRYASNVHGMPADDFPLIPTADGEAPAASIDGALLKAAISQVTVAAATDEARPLLTGVLFQLGEGQLTMAAADGFRLAVREIDITNGASAKATVPAAALDEVARVATKNPIQVTLNDNRAIFRADQMEIATRLIEGNFPDYGQIVPARHDVRVLANARDLLKAVQVAKLFATSSADAVRLTITSSRIQVDSGMDQVGSNRSDVGAMAEGADGEGITIGFGGTFLADALKAIGTENVDLRLTTAQSPCLLQPMGLENGTYIHVLMPMHLGGR